MKSERFKYLGPFQVKNSLRLLYEEFQKGLNSNNLIIQQQSKFVCDLLEKNPILIDGTFSDEEFAQQKEVIEQIMPLIFPETLTNNEIKAAFFAYSTNILYASERLKNILKNTAEDFDVFGQMYKNHGESFELMVYAVILVKYYQYNLDIEKAKVLNITDKNGLRKRYKLTFNGDFLDIYPNENAIEITPEILNELLANTQDEHIWKKYFPENSWTVEGFGLITLVDTSLEEEIDDFKTHLIETNETGFALLQEDIRRIFKIPDLTLGSFAIENNQLVAPKDKDFDLISFENEQELQTQNFACSNVNKQLFTENRPVVIPNVEKYHEECAGNRLSKTLLKKGYKSLALVPITINANLQFVLEIGSKKINQINAISMSKFGTIMPFIQSYSERIINEFQNEISAVIQQECTSIHPSVEWRFQEIATKFIQDRRNGKSPNFQEIIFENVLPLYGQIDIVGSSAARNEAIQIDLTQQLTESKAILQQIFADKELPFYEQLAYQIDKFLFELKEQFHTSLEQEINQFFEYQIFPLFTHLNENQLYTKDISIFLNHIDQNIHSLYNARKRYDQTVDLTNQLLSNVIEEQQLKAQKMFPHYFEKFKTDGVEHNMYIGETISKSAKYHETDLYNLRLWQLQVMCEMEALFYSNQAEMPNQLEVASLILAYDVPLTIRYRMDEKQFDVDGAYNVRYEMIKKRIDKAHIKNSEERLTQPHKLCVVYSSANIEREYLNYFEFLQSKNYIGKNIEIVELEELQGASGIKALRVDLNNDLKMTGKVFTVADLESV